MNSQDHPFQGTISDSWKEPPAAEGLVVEGPRVQGAHDGNTARVSQAFVYAHRHAIGKLVSVSVAYMPELGEFVTHVTGMDGAIRVYGYTVGGGAPGEAMLLAMLGWLGLKPNFAQVTDPLKYGAGERTWKLNRVFEDFPFDLRKLRAR